MLLPDFQELIGLKNKTGSLRLPANSLIRSVMHGNYLSPFRGNGLEFEEVRKYVYGDDVRKIEWRVTARTGSPHVKVFTEERTRRILLIVDSNSSMRFGTRGTFKSIQAAKCASLLGWCAHQNHNLLGSCIFGDIEKNIYFLKPKLSRFPLYEMINTLCKEPILQKNPVTLPETLRFLRSTRSSFDLTFIISDFMSFDDNLVSELRHLRTKSSVIFIPINDPIESNLENIGNLACFSPGSSEGLFIDTSNDSGREIYFQQWQERSKKLKQMAIDLSIGLIELKTDQDIYLDLFHGLQNSYIHSASDRR